MKTIAFLSEFEAVAAWGDIYRRLSKKNEYVVFVYSTIEKGDKLYYTGRTYKGMRKHGPIRPNVLSHFYIYFL